MQLAAIGGDLRMNGLLLAARRAGFVCHAVLAAEELSALDRQVTAIALPWPRSFQGGLVMGTQITKEELLERMPACDILMGGGLDAAAFPGAKALLDPGGDEALLDFNARLTAEGAVAALLGAGGNALIGRTCLITGFGRIAQALAKRLCALEMFVIVCARNEAQMQQAHRMGAHPVVLRSLASATAQADVVLNTIPARVFGSEALSAMRPGIRFIELASAPYSADPELATKLGVGMEIMGGIPGKYAPQQAGEALFAALERAMRKESVLEGEG